MGGVTAELVRVTMDACHAARASRSHLRIIKWTTKP